MVATPAPSLWSAPGMNGAGAGLGVPGVEFARLWHAFMTARLTLAAVLLLLQTSMLVLNASHDKSLLIISLAYCINALLARLFGRPSPLGNAFNAAWLTLVGLDILVILALQSLQGGNINYTPLCVLPILLTAVLGSLRLALGTAAGVTVLLLGQTWWLHLGAPVDLAPPMAQSALAGAGYLAIALLSNQLASRLASEGQRAHTNQLAADVQRQVNELVIESLADGIVVVDSNLRIRAANPAARQMLGCSEATLATPQALDSDPSWADLMALANASLHRAEPLEGDLSIRGVGRGELRLRVRSHSTTPAGSGGEPLCVLFLHDQREIEARMRTEKLASMGRMSTAVAHEIRNPLAAISQANALLDEDLQDPRLKRLTAMVGQNAKRLERIVEDILKVARLQPHGPQALVPALAVGQVARDIVRDWLAQTGYPHPIALELGPTEVREHFDAEHLRQVLFNLLDNARRFAQDEPYAIQLYSAVQGRRSSLSLWSKAPPLDPSVERHLFEPFFSSESRSSGLGLYICRELCQRHGATLGYERLARRCNGQDCNGNAFTIRFAMPTEPAPALQGGTTT